MCILSGYHNIDVNVEGCNLLQRMDGFCGFIRAVGAAKENQNSLIAGCQRNCIAFGNMEGGIEYEIFGAK